MSNKHDVSRLKGTEAKTIIDGLETTLFNRQGFLAVKNLTVDMMLTREDIEFMLAAYEHFIPKDSASVAQG